MSGPWEEYSSAKAGPWSQYAKPKKAGAVRTLTGAAATFNRVIPFGDELVDGFATVVGDAIKHPTGKGSDLKGEWQRQRAKSKGAADQFAREHPVAASLTKGIGNAAQVAPAFLTGGGSLAPQATGLAGKALALARPAVAAGASSALAGLGSEGTVQQRARQGSRDALTGAVVGAFVPAAIGAAGGVRRAVGGVASGVGRTAVRAANRIADKGGSAFLDPTREAGKRLSEALRKDGVNPEGVRTALNGWMTAGNDAPALQDLAGKNTLRLLRAAAGKGGAAGQQATQFGRGVAADLQDRAVDLTRRLTPDEPRAASQLVDDITARQKAEAAVNYAPLRDIEVPILNENTARAVSDPVGRRVVGNAREVAEWRMDDDQLRAFDRLAAGDVSQPVNADVLHKVAREFREQGGRFSQALEGGKAGGALTRRDIIEDELSDVPEFARAQEAFRNDARRVEAVDVGRGADGEAGQLFSNPDAYARRLAQFDDVEGRDLAGVGARDEIIRQIGAPTEGATGYLNKLATGRNPGLVLGETYGDEATGAYRQGLDNELDRLRTARFIDPDQGSQTYGRLEEQGLVDLPALPTTPGGVFKLLAKGAQAAHTLTDAEREALVRIGQAPADFGLIGQTADQARRLIPRILSPQLSYAGGVTATNDQRTN